jgi:hypothetical protein
MTDEDAVAGKKKEGKKRTREDSDSEVQEVAAPDRRITERERDMQWKKWVMEKLDKAEKRAERMEEEVGKITLTLEAICGYLRTSDGGVPAGSDDEEVEETEGTLREPATESENAEEAEKRADEDVKMGE